MNIIKKQVAEVITFDIDYTEILDNTDTIVSVTATCPTPNIVKSASVATNKVFVTVQNGTLNATYTITVRATTNSGNVLEEDITLEIYADKNLLIDIKKTLRVSSSSFDDEINDLIEAAKMDLALSGILSTKIVETDMLIKRAIIYYVKANFGFDNPEAEKLQQSYNLLKGYISMSQDYL